MNLWSHRFSRNLYNCSYVGRNGDFINSFRNCLTFSSVLGYPIFLLKFPDLYIFMFIDLFKICNYSPLHIFSFPIGFRWWRLITWWKCEDKTAISASRSQGRMEESLTAPKSEPCNEFIKFFHESWIYDFFFAKFYVCFIL